MPAGHTQRIDVQILNISSKRSIPLSDFARASMLGAVCGLMRVGALFAVDLARAADEVPVEHRLRHIEPLADVFGANVRVGEKSFGRGNIFPDYV